ncbi:YncE family protein [Paenibacillus piscarius]|uniref:YncE family protein n=1 Tax=Paenibacillus piscarius TaxID=1089681 RepID=UPI001EE91E2D|nr:YncE family protein [Paenibacillus piscarius]
MNEFQAKSSRNIRSLNTYPYVYASYVTDSGTGAVAVIDPLQDKIIYRIPTGYSPSAMCTDYYSENLFVTDDRSNFLTVYSLDDYKPVLNRRVGTSSAPKPVAVTVEPTSKKAYVANYGDHCVTIIDLNTKRIKNVPIVTLQPGVQGRPFAFTVTENSPFVYVACKNDHGSDFVAAIGVEDDKVYSLDFEDDITITFDGTRNPLTIHPDTHTLVSLGNVGILNYIREDRPVGEVYDTISLLDNTVSGFYLHHNKMLFCTTRRDKDYLKVFKNLEIDADRNITYENFFEVPSYKGQDKIRLATSEKAIAVTIQPTDLPSGGLQIIYTGNMQSQFYPLYAVGDMTFWEDQKAYVAANNSVRPIDLGTGQMKPAIPIGGTNITVRNLISDYSYQSS